MVKQSIFAVCVCACALTSTGRSETTVQVRPATVIIPHQTVSISDVAIVNGAESARIANLDLDLVEPGKVVSVSKRQVALRLQLAGFSRIEVTGSDEVLVQRADLTDLKSRLKRQLKAKLCEQFACSDDRLSVNFAREEQVNHLMNRLRSSDFSLEVLSLGTLPLGRNRFQVRFQAEGQESFVDFLELEVVQTLDLAMTMQPIARGQKIDSSMVTSVSRPIADRTQVTLSMRDVIGKVAETRIAQNSTIRATEVREEKPLVLRPNTLIDVVATLGGTEIRLKDAKLLSSASVGQRARFRNTRTGREFAATLISPTLAELTLVR